MKTKDRQKASEGQARYKERFSKNANYDAIQDEPANRMGSSSFANMPEEAMVNEYMMPQYRDGIINSFSAGVSQLSGIEENRRKTRGDA